MNTTPADNNIDKRELSARLSKCVELLKEFRSTFLHYAIVESEGKFPTAFLYFDNALLEGATGILQLNSLPRAGKINCRFKPRSGGEELRWTHYETEYDLSEYERLLFSIWSYDTGFALDRNEHSKAVWFIDDQAIADRFEDIAKRIDELLNTITKPRSLLFTVAGARSVIRNERPKWKPCRVNWGYVQQLDKVISDFEHTLKRLSASIETEQDVASGKAALLSNIRKAYAEIEKLAEADVNFDKVSAEEINFAEAAVIEYLTKRFGEQDDGLGNWPRDWHECPEAFDLYKQKIKEYRTIKAKANLDDAKRIAEAQPEQKIEPDKGPKKEAEMPSEHDQIETFDDLYTMLAYDLQEYGSVLAQTYKASIIAGITIRRKYAAKGFSLPEMPEKPTATKLMDWCTTCEQITRSGKPKPEKEPTKRVWITVSEAAENAKVHRGTISKWAKDGKIEDNGKKGPDRRIEKSSLLLWLDERKKKERQKGFKDYSQTLDDIPDRH